MVDYDKENIPESTVKKVNAILNLPEMNLDAVKSASRALAGIYTWSAAMMKYHELLKVNPRRQIDWAAMKVQNGEWVLGKSNDGGDTQAERPRKIASKTVMETRFNGTPISGGRVSVPVKDIQMLKALSAPPHMVKDAFAVAMMLLGEKS